MPLQPDQTKSSLVYMSEVIYNIQEAKTHLSRLVEEAISGSDIVVAKAGKPLVRLTPYKPVLKPRSGGQLSGQIQETPGWWHDDDDPLAESLDAELDNTPKSS